MNYAGELSRGTQFEFRQITHSDLAACHALSQKMGWAHRRDDWLLAFELGHGFVAVIAEEVIATALWWPYGESRATLGMIMVDPELQGRGIGGKLMDALLDQTQGRALALNATPEGKPLYEKVGFETTGLIRQYSGRAEQPTEPTLAAGERLVEGSAVTLEAIAALDHAATGLSRQTMLSRLRLESECVMLQRDNVSVGFSMLRKFGRGLLIGPVVATDLEAATVLIDHWIFGHRGQFVRIDLTDVPELGQQVEAAGLAPVSVATTMRRGSWPKHPGPAMQFSIASQAFG